MNPKDRLGTILLILLACTILLCIVTFIFGCKKQESKTYPTYSSFYTQQYLSVPSNTVCSGDNVRKFILDAAIDTIRVGRLGHSVYYLSDTDDVKFIISHLPGGGPAKALSASDMRITDLSIANRNIKGGKFSNSLVVYTLILAINLHNSDLGGFSLRYGYLTTRKSDCSGKPVMCSDDTTAIQSLHMQDNVVSYLTSTDNATIQGLLDLANDMLGSKVIPGHGWPVPAPSYTEVCEQINTVINAFSNSAVFLGYFTAPVKCGN